MRNVKLTLEYDGSAFFGFQRQKDKPTIQAALEEALSKLFNRRMKIAAAAGRTDSGVHARGQAVNFKTSSRMPLDKIQKGLNALLPEAVAVKEVKEVSPGFHARYQAKSKTYEYVVLNSAVRSPLLNGRACRYPYPLDVRRMKQAAKQLVGRHDFKAFQASGSSAGSSVRTIHRFSVSVVHSSSPLPLGEWVGLRGKLIRFVVEADGFLYHMVRNMVGTLLQVGRGKLSLQDFSGSLRSRRRSLTGPTAPPQGLTLLSVTY